MTENIDHGPWCPCEPCTAKWDWSPKVVLLTIAGIIIGLAVAVLVTRWAVDAWWVSQHCTTVLGTRVCQ